MTETRTPIDPAAGTGLDADDVRRIEQAQRIEAIRRRRNGVQAGRVVPPGPRTGGASTVTLPPIDLGRPELPTTEVPALGEPLVSKAAGGAPVTPSAAAPSGAKRTGRGAGTGPLPGTGATAAGGRRRRPHPAQGGRLAATAIGTAGMFGLVAMMGFMGRRGAAEATEALPAPAPTPVVVVVHQAPTAGTTADAAVTADGTATDGTPAASRAA